MSEENTPTTPETAPTEAPVVEDKAPVAETPAEAPAETPKEEPAAPEGDTPKEDTPAEDTPEDDKPVLDKDTPLDKDVWGDVGTDSGNAALTVLQNSGLSPEDAKAILWDAAQNQDASLVDHKALVEKVGEAAASIIETGLSNHITESKAHVAVVTKEVHGAAGGEANWNKVVEWANKGGISQEQLSEYAPMIDKGGAAARFATSEMLGHYNQDDGNTTIQGAGRIEGAPSAAPRSKSLTCAEFMAKSEDYHAGKIDAAEYKQASDARERGRKQGK